MSDFKLHTKERKDSVLCIDSREGHIPRTCIGVVDYLYRWSGMTGSVDVA